jgi:hypothetical protein
VRRKEQLKVWTYTTYILFNFTEYLKRKGKLDPSKPFEFSFGDFANFVFEELWGKHGMVFHDTKEDLEKDVDLLSKLGIVEYDKRLKKMKVDLERMQLLQTIGCGMQKDPMRKKIPMVNEYLSRIEQSVLG